MDEQQNYANFPNGLAFFSPLSSSIPIDVPQFRARTTHSSNSRERE